MNIFEKASRMGIRYPTGKGLLSVEDLWNLPLQSKNGVSLDNIAMGLNRVSKDAGEESFVTERSTISVEVEVAFDVVKRVIEVKMAENAAALTAKGDKEHNQKIMGLIAGKQVEELQTKSVEELTAMMR